MNKKRILEQLKKSDYLAGSRATEVKYFETTIQRIREHDYDGLVEIAREAGLELGPVFSVLEGRAVNLLKSGEMARMYELALLETMFGDPGEEPDEDQAGPELGALDRDRIRELYLVLCAPTFGERQMVRIKYLVSEWGLEELAEYFWEKGLLTFLNERYEKTSGEKDQQFPAEYILERAEPGALFNEQQIVDDYIFDETGSYKHIEGLKEDLQKEKESRGKASRALDRLYGALAARPPNYREVRRMLLELHRNRQVDQIHKQGILYLRKFLRSDWLTGAREVGRRYGLKLPDSIEEMEENRRLAEVNARFVSQAEIGERGHLFLRREALLSHRQNLQSGHCFSFPGGFMLAVLMPHEEEEHFIFGQFPTPFEQTGFIRNLLVQYFQHNRLKSMAEDLIEKYLKEHSSRIRLRNALRIAVFASPVVLVVSLLVGWIYTLTIGETGEALMLGAALVAIGETIAARNGYSQKINPDTQPLIPSYALRVKGVLNFTPIAGEEPARAVKS